MDSFNIWVIRSRTNSNLIDDVCLSEAVAKRRCRIQHQEVAEATVVSINLLQSIKDHSVASNAVIAALKEVSENQAKDLADAGRALARLQREHETWASERAELERKVTLLQREVNNLKYRLGEINQ